MLNERLQSPRRRGQRGVVLLIALIVLVVMTLAAVALVRSVDTSNLIAGNMAFQQAAVHSGDAGVEDAIVWLEDCAVHHVSCTTTTLDADSASHGYSANGSDPTKSPGAGQTWNAYWAATKDATNTRSLGRDDVTGNTVSYVIDRLCRTSGSPTSGASCVGSPVVTAATGNEEEAGGIPLRALSVVYYRITVRIAGPRNSVSYVQAMISL